MNYLIVLVCAIWGSNWVFMKLSGQFFPPVMFSALRFGTASLVLLGIIWYKKTPLPKREDWKWYVLCGLLQTTYIYLVTQIALMYNSAAITSVISFTMPFWFLILGHFFLNDRITPPKFIGLVVGIIGLFFVMDINPWHMTWTGVQLWTEFLVLTGAAAWATTSLITKKYLIKNDQLQFTTWQMISGTLGLFLYSLIFEKGQAISWNAISVICILYSGVLASAVAYLLWSIVLTKGDPVKASVSVLLVPVIGSLCSWLFLGETLKIISVIGIVLVATGIGVVNMKLMNWAPENTSTMTK